MRRESVTAKNRWRYLLHIGQAHLAPGMNLEKWRTILAKHKALDGSALVSNATVQAIADEITAIVEQAKGGS